MRSRCIYMCKFLKKKMKPIFCTKNRTWTLRSQKATGFQVTWLFKSWYIEVQKVFIDLYRILLYFVWIQTLLVNRNYIIVIKKMPTLLMYQNDILPYPTKKRTINLSYKIENVWKNVIQLCPGVKNKNYHVQLYLLSLNKPYGATDGMLINPHDFLHKP